MGSPALTEFSPTVWSLPLLRLMLRLTQRLTPGFTITDSAMLLIPMDTAITGTVLAMLVWAIMATAMGITWDMLDTTATTSATTARGRPKLNQLPRLTLKLPQRLIPGCTTAALVMLLARTDMGITDSIWAILAMLDITPTLTTEAAEITTEPMFPVPGNSVDVSA